MRFSAHGGAVAVLFVALTGCRRSEPSPSTAHQSPSTPKPRDVAAAPGGERASPTPESEPTAPPSMFEDEPDSTERANATWYNVPQKSLAKRRAPDEFTAAHDRFPLGSYVRVTNEASSRSVIVRITDRGLDKKRGIDLCKEAAEAIGIVGAGAAKVRLDVLRERAR